jgi:hypothetical protein
MLSSGMIITPGLFTSPKTVTLKLIVFIDTKGFKAMFFAMSALSIHELNSFFVRPVAFTLPNRGNRINPKRSGV